MMKKLAMPIPKPIGLKANISDLQALVDENYAALGGKGNTEIPRIMAEAKRKRESGESLTDRERLAYRLIVEERLLGMLRDVVPPD